MENNEHQQHLDLITNMIGIARREFNDNSFIYLLWGWAVSICCVAEFVLLQMNKEYHPMVWLLLVPTGIAQFVIMARQEKTERIKTHMDKLLGYVWTAVGVCIGITLLSMEVLQQGAYPVLIMLYGIGTFISGRIMALRPMVAGAICCWVIALVAFHVAFQYQLLLLPLSLLLAYIIPGYILKNRFKAHV